MRRWPPTAASPRRSAVMRGSCFSRRPPICSPTCRQHLPPIRACRRSALSVTARRAGSRSATRRSTPLRSTNWRAASWPGTGSPRRVPTSTSGVATSQGAMARRWSTRSTPSRASMSPRRPTSPVRPPSVATSIWNTQQAMWRPRRWLPASMCSGTRRSQTTRSRPRPKTRSSRPSTDSTTRSPPRSRRPSPTGRHPTRSTTWRSGRSTTSSRIPHRSHRPMCRRCSSSSRPRPPTSRARVPRSRDWPPRSMRHWPRRPPPSERLPARGRSL